MTMTNQQQYQQADAAINRFVQRFGESYRLLCAYAAQPLVLTPDLLGYLRSTFLSGQVPWVAEADLLLSELCSPIGYEQYVIEPAVRVLLLEQLPRLVGAQRAQESALLLLGYLRHLVRTQPLLRAEDLQAQQWGAMAYLDDQRAVVAHELGEALTAAVSATDRLALARLTQVTAKLADQLAAFPELIERAGAVSRWLAGELPAEQPDGSRMTQQTTDSGQSTAVLVNFQDMVITIRASGAAVLGYPSDEKYIVSARSSIGEANSMFESPSTQPEFQQVIERLKRDEVDERVLTTIGTMLFTALFRDAVADLYRQTMAILAPNQQLRLVLDVSRDEQIDALPWELLNDPNQGPLALLTSLVRYLPQSQLSPRISKETPLRVLLTAAQTPPTMDVEREINAVTAALSALGDLVDVTIEPHLTIAKFAELVRSGFHVWHFVGHGGFAADATTGQLLYEDAYGDPEMVSASHLGSLLNATELRLIILDSCSSGQFSTEPFRNVAQTLIHAQIPAVLALQFRNPGEATLAFSSECYRALTESLPIDLCVSEGRKAIMNSSGLGRQDWAVPKIYTSVLDGQLFVLPQPEAKQQLRRPAMKGLKAAARVDPQHVSTESLL